MSPLHACPRCHSKSDGAGFCYCQRGGVLMAPVFARPVPRAMRATRHDEPDSLGRATYHLAWSDTDGTPRGQVWFGSADMLAATAYRNGFALETQP